MTLHIRDENCLQEMTFDLYNCSHMCLLTQHYFLMYGRQFASYMKIYLKVWKLWVQP
jgi:hypothetical protein